MVAVLTPSHVVVVNCDDSRAVLIRNGKALPLSSDPQYKPTERARMHQSASRTQRGLAEQLYSHGGYVAGIGVSRALGDFRPKIDWSSSAFKVTVGQLRCRRSCRRRSRISSASRRSASPHVTLLRAFSICCWGATVFRT